MVAVSLFILADLAIANSFTLLKELPNHKLYKNNGSEKPQRMLDFRKKLSIQLIRNYREDYKKCAGDPDTQAGEHWSAHTPTKRVCRNCKKNKVPGERIST